MDKLWIFATVAVTILIQEEGWTWYNYHLDADLEFDNKFATGADLLLENTTLLTGYLAFKMDHTPTSDLSLSTHYWRAAKKKSGTALTENEILFFISVCFNQENILNLNLIYRDTLYTCHWSWTPCCWRDDVTPGVPDTGGGVWTLSISDMAVVADMDMDLTLVTVCVITDCHWSQNEDKNI